ncbi:hypothetical protein BKA83DRAFT_2006454 [Pisolithus microcarpus]|nr:hypothetical protein BKA83DRAFT_2006454 [Pisolithus microcarpus]
MFSLLCPALQTVQPEIYAGAGQSGITAALTLARNVRIIEKEPQHRHGQCGSGVQPRTFEAFHFLRAPEIHERATPALPVQEHKRGLFEPLQMFSMIGYMEPTPTIPYWPAPSEQHHLPAFVRVNARLSQATDETCDERPTIDEAGSL